MQLMRCITRLLNLRNEVLILGIISESINKKFNLFPQTYAIKRNYEATPALTSGTWMSAVKAIGWNIF